MAADSNGYHSSDPKPASNFSTSPPTSPGHLHCRQNKSQQLQFKHHRRRGRSFYVAGMFRRRNILRCLLLLPLVLYFSGVITCVGPLSAILYRPPPGSIYRSHEVFEKLWPYIQSDNSSKLELSSIWRYKIKLRERRSCLNTIDHQRHVFSRPDHFLIVEANGGLNQQRSSICNAVAVAGLLNASLVIPKFEFHKVWRDSSKFAEIYDEDYFISTLRDFVTVVPELPEKLMRAYDFNISNIPNFRARAWVSANYYLEAVYPFLRDHRVIRLSPFANRLATSIPPHIQFLRCLANYKALRFSSAISMLAHNLVNRMKQKSSISGGKYVSVHLRFEEDMLAFSCCVYDGGKSETSEMDAIREKGWGKKFKSRDRIIAPGLNRFNGRCPMTPLEVGMMLRGMGFSNDTPIFLASGKIYQAERNLAPLQKMFPHLYTKESLATADELAEYQNYSSRLAALDYIVCLFSEVFVTTQGGNFPHFLMGHRSFLHNGHSKTIKPDKRKLILLLQNSTISWDAFKNEMRSMLAESDRKGTLVPHDKKSRRKYSIYSNPLPECRCLLESNNSSNGFLPKIDNEYAN